jgi:hypothetical protein
MTQGQGDPPTLDYHKPEAPPRPKPTPADSGIGLLGFVLYGGLALLFLAWAAVGVFSMLVFGVGARMSSRMLVAVTAVLTVSLTIGLFCLWRAIVAFRQFIR